MDEISETDRKHATDFKNFKRLRKRPLRTSIPGQFRDSLSYLLRNGSDVAM